MIHENVISAVVTEEACEPQNLLADPAETKPTVFILDDNWVVARAIAELLEIVGFASTPLKSISEFQESCKLNAPDCLLLNERVGGQSGMEILLSLRRNDVGVPIIMMMASFEESELAAKAASLGIVAFLEKPFHSEQLCKTVQRAVDRYVE